MCVFSFGSGLVFGLSALGLVFRFELWALGFALWNRLVLWVLGSRLFSPELLDFGFGLGSVLWACCLVAFAGWLWLTMGTQ